MLSLFFYKRRKVFVFILLLLISFAFMAFSGNQGGFTINVKQVLQSIVYPFQWVFAKVWNFIADVFQSITKIQQYRDKLEETQRRLQQLSKTYQEVEELRNQIRVLKEALGLRDELRQTYQQNPISARVITLDPQNAYLTLIIDKGSNDGLKVNMVVVGYYQGKAGVIGRIVETTPFTAKVLPIHDKASNIGAMISRTRVTGIIEGRGRHKALNLAYIPSDENVRAGDLIVTSPESDLFPQGLVIGHVTNVKDVQGAFHKEVLVEPFIKYNQIEIVFILQRLPNENVQRLEGQR